MYLARKGIYTSGGQKPSFAESLNATKYSIILQYTMRIAPEDFGDLGGSSTAVTFWNDVLDWLKKPNHTATNIAESFELDSAFKLKEYAPEAPDSLYAAAAYWFEAADAHNRLNDTERGWSALLMSNSTSAWPAVRSRRSKWPSARRQEERKSRAISARFFSRTTEVVGSTSGP